MNKHILVAMDWKNRSKEELNENYQAAYDALDARDPLDALDAHAAAATAADAAATAAFAATAADAFDAYAAVRATHYAYTYAAADVEQWLNRYFKETGENRKEYEKALEEMRK